MAELRKDNRRPNPWAERTAGAILQFAIIGCFLAGILASGCRRIEEADRVTPEFLLRNGFVQSKTNPEHYTLTHIRLREAAKQLGFAPNQLVHGTSAPPDSDIRSVVVRDYHMRVISEEKDSNGWVHRDSLDNPESLCSVEVWLLPQWRTDFGNGEALFTKRASGDAARFILDHALALSTRPIATTNLPAIRGQWRYLEDQGLVVMRLPANRSSEVQSFLRQAFGPPTEIPTKGRPYAFFAYMQAETNGFELTFQHCPEYVQVRMSRTVKVKGSAR